VRAFPSGQWSDDDYDVFDGDKDIGRDILFTNEKSIGPAPTSKSRMRLSPSKRAVSIGRRN
jgi:hypothetical protein